MILQNIKLESSYFGTILVLIISLYTSIRYFSLNLLYIFGIITTVFGLVIWLVARLTIKENLTILPKAKKLVKRGIYSRIRHPIYLGLIMTFFGLSMMMKSVLVFGVFIILTLIHIIRAREEEKVLIKKFGDKYIRYKKKTWF